MDSFLEPKCHPETRTKMLEDLREWAVNTHPDTTVLWLYGPAGAGKSAIMRTLATQLHEDGSLGGCFFFKRAHATRGNARAVFTTIAYQLALNIEWLRTAISRVVEKNPSILARSITAQMQELVSEPCRSHKHRNSVVILIDGLDECDGHAFQGEVLRAIRNPTPNHPSFLRFIVASRPEPHIRQVFDSPSSRHRSFNVEQSFHDVRHYLRDEFSRIHRDHPTMNRVQWPWPKPCTLEALVGKSSGYFIYASTIIKFIGDENYQPTQRLAMVQDSSSTGSASPFEALDQLYFTILSSCPRHSELNPILCAIVHLRVSPEDVDQLFRLAEGETRLLLRGLHSVLDIPTNDENTLSSSTNRKISSYHASFLDFLNNPGRSRTFCVGTLRNRIDLARSVLEAYVGPHENTDEFWPRFLRHDLIPFITSLPPSGELAVLLPLIGTIDPASIFAFFAIDVPGQMLAWLRKIPSAPPALIRLWEDYEWMVSFEGSALWCSPSQDPGKRIFSCSPEFLRILVSLVGFRNCGLDGLSELRARLDLKWTEIRTSICGPSSNLATDELGIAVRTALRDVALQCIRKMVKNELDIGGELYSRECRDAALESTRRHRHQIDDDATEEEIYKREAHRMEQLVSVIVTDHFIDKLPRCKLVDAISYLVRLSPPCPVLYRELWYIPLASTSDHPLHGCLLIHHVSKWLECFFTVPAMELIAFWKRADVDLDSPPNPFAIYGLEPESVEEVLKDWVKGWNRVIVRLDLPDQLKLPLL
ncbi:hypothetical protein C8R45DRAFT_568388 [Mycena sanguinolenta]|nr:hypothetical protein C8R45DRAFT_568388 [Mycena sanguinolenta]